MEHIKRCPCCKTNARMIEQIPPEAPYYSKICFKVRCTKCGLATAWHDTPDEALYMWNRRGGRVEK